jgi:hypothetical protein
MKIRILKKLIDGVFDVRIQTEDWSENDVRLMVKYGEPEVNLGGVLVIPPTADASSPGSSDEPTEVELDVCYARVMSESPFTYKFDSRDYGGIDGARTVASAWASMIESRLVDQIRILRDKDSFFTTEEIMEY